MTNKWFIDTGAWFALFYKRDQHYSEAVRLWHRIENEQVLPVTTNFVLDELATLLARSTTYDFSGQRLKEIYNSDIQIKRPAEDDEQQALDYFIKYGDQKISFTDCLSFVVMQKNAIKHVFTFDRHFEYAGFEIIH